MSHRRAISVISAKMYHWRCNKCCDLECEGRASADRFLTAEHYGGVVAGVIVVITALRVLRDASMDLMDTMPSADALQEVSKAALTIAGVEAIEQVRARKTGLRWHVDIHVEVDPELTVRQSHDIATDVRTRIRAAVPWVADTLVHIEPHQRS
jgi:divalent metal cation (Fe/Co/Zn/Cd) transporter